jgi:hypothetical protein
MLKGMEQQLGITREGTQQIDRQRSSGFGVDTVACGS